MTLPLPVNTPQILPGSVTDSHVNDVSDAKVTGLQRVVSATVARTDTAAKTLFTLPANAVITGLKVSSPAVSNAATTATLSIGKAGGTDYLNALDVKGATGSGQQHPTGAVLGSIGTSAVPVTGIYAETGGASSAGGPWTVIVEYVGS